MARRTPNKGKPWTAMEVLRQRALAKAQEENGSSKASEKKSSFKPTNRREK